MEKKLPEIFHNRIDKKINNNKAVFYGNKENKINETKKEEKVNIQQKINSIFSSPNYVYKADVEIILKDKNITTKLIGRNKNYLITMDNELINILNIVDIKKTN